jgi:hypothetical protein
MRCVHYNARESGYIDPFLDCGVTRYSAALCTKSDQYLVCYPHVCIAGKGGWLFRTSRAQINIHSRELLAAQYFYYCVAGRKYSLVDVLVIVYLNENVCMELLSSVYNSSLIPTETTSSSRCPPYTQYKVQSK